MTHAIQQDIFDTVAKHLFTQGKRAFENGKCVYRTNDGLKCAVGALIPDDAYKPVMDKSLECGGTGVITLISRFEDDLPDYFSENRNLLSELQCVHDNSDNWFGSETMRIELKEVADNYSLNAGILDDLSFEWEWKK